MVKHGLLLVLPLSTLLFAASAATASDFNAKATKAKPTAAHAPQAATRKPAASTPVSPAPLAHKNAKPTLGDGLIAQNALRIYLNRPAAIMVHDSRGQLLYHIESVRPMEYLPLSGVHTGFLYLTLRAGRLETTKKLIYSGK